MCLGIPGQVVEVTDSNHRLALVDFSGVRRQVNMQCVIDDDHPLEASVGTWVVVHVGFAMSRIDEREAEATLKLLAELGEVQRDIS